MGLHASEFGKNLYPIHVLGLQALGPLLDLELHLRAFIQGTVAVRLDRRKVNEYTSPLDRWMNP